MEKQTGEIKTATEMCQVKEIRFRLQKRYCSAMMITIETTVLTAILEITKRA